MPGITDFISHSESESRRFDLAIYRGGELSPGDVPAFFLECAKKRPDVVILRMEAAAAEILLRLVGHKCHIIPADSLIEFRKVLRKDTVADLLGSGTRIEELTPDSVHLLDDVVRRCYVNYSNHYHANPCLDADKVLAGLNEFSRGFLGKKNRTVFLAYDGDQPCGYLCMELENGRGSTVIGGSALDIPVPLRHKVLCDLTHYGDLWLLERGATRFYAVTRADKSYIQKLLVHNMHCLPAQSLVTLHLNFFLGKMTTSAQASPASLPTGLPEFQTGAFSLKKYRIRDHGDIEKRLGFVLRKNDEIFSYFAEADRDGICALGAVTDATDRLIPT